MPSPGSQSKDNDTISASRFAKVGRTLDSSHSRKSKLSSSQVDFTILDSSRHSSANSSVTFECDELHQNTTNYCHGRFLKTKMPQIQQNKKNDKILLGYSTESLTSTDSFREMTILLRKKNLIIRILMMSIFLLLPFLVGNLISNIEKERIFFLFETNLFCMKVKTMASFEHCKEMEKVRKTVLQDWYE